MSGAVKLPRTFGDIARRGHGWDFGAKCSFCKRYASPTLRVWKYSTRHYVCAECCAKRADVVLPKVKRREAFKAAMDKAARGES